MTHLTLKKKTIEIYRLQILILTIFWDKTIDVWRMVIYISEDIAAYIFELEVWSKNESIRFVRELVMSNQITQHRFS